MGANGAILCAVALIPGNLRFYIFPWLSSPVVESKIGPMLKMAAEDVTFEEIL
jgi:hypothetical protein